MSHFLLLVTGDNLSEQLQPFHEFECTGTNDQYVVDVDRTEEARAEYETATATLVIQFPTGEKVFAFGDNGNFLPEFAKYADSQARLSLPEGYVELRDEPAKAHQTFTQWAFANYGGAPVPHGTQPDTDGQHKHGYGLLDESGELVKLVNRTNPNAKWDWWVIGGRYAGRILTKTGELHNEARKGDIDFDTMRQKAASTAEVDYDSAHRIIAGRIFTPWSQIQKEYEGRTDDGRAFYHAQPVIQDWQANDARRWDDPEDYLVDREAFIELARKKAFASFAVLHEGKWSERGEMGWFGCVADDKGDSWYEGFSALIDGLSDDTMLTFVDCHI